MIIIIIYVIKGVISVQELKEGLANALEASINEEQGNHCYDDDDDDVFDDDDDDDNDYHFSDDDDDGGDDDDDDDDNHYVYIYDDSDNILVIISSRQPTIHAQIASYILSYFVCY